MNAANTIDAEQEGWNAASWLRKDTSETKEFYPMLRGVAGI